MSEKPSLVAQLIIDRTKALEAIQELHKPCKTFLGKEVCDSCNAVNGRPITFPCKTRRLADEAIGKTNGNV